MKLTILTTVLLLLGGLNTHAQYNKGIQSPKNLVNKTHTERTVLLFSFYEEGIRDLDSVEIFKQIASVENLAKEHEDEELMLETDLMKLHYYVYRDYFKEDFVVAKIENLYQRAVDKNIKWLKIRTQSLLGNYLYYFRENYGRGYEHLLRCAELLNNCSAEEYPLKQICLFQVAQINFSFRYYEQSKKYLLQALHAKSSHNRYYYEMHIVNTLALYYRIEKEYDKSDYYFNRALDRALESQDSVWGYILNENLAGNLFRQEKHKEAIPYLEKALNYGSNSEVSLVDALILYGSVSLALGNLEKANSLNYSAESLIRDGEYYNKLYYYTFRSKLEAENNRPELASSYIDSILFTKDGIEEKYSSKTLLMAKQKLIFEKQKFEHQKMEQTEARKAQIRNGAILILVLVVIILGLIYKRYRHRAVSRETSLLHQKDKVEKTLKESQLSYSEKLEQAMAEVERLKRIPIDSMGENAKKQILERLEKIVILNDKDWRDFVELFNMIHIGFFDRLEQKHPDLTKAEVKVLALSKLKFGNQEMALAIGVSPGAIRQTKLRIRTKMSTEKSMSVDAFVDLI